MVPDVMTSKTQGSAGRRDSPRFTGLIPGSIGLADTKSEDEAATGTALALSWNPPGEEAAGGLKTVVTWALTPTQGGIGVRMEQSGFRPKDEANYQGAGYGWPRILDGLERVTATLD